MLEVTGVVNSPNALTEESCCPFSDTFGALRWCLGTVPVKPDGQTNASAAAMTAGQLVPSQPSPTDLPPAAPSSTSEKLLSCFLLP